MRCPTIVGEGICQSRVRDLDDADEADDDDDDDDDDKADGDWTNNSITDDALAKTAMMAVTYAESATTPKHGPCTKDDTLNQREATNMIDAEGERLHFKSVSAVYELQTMELLRGGYPSGSACGPRDVKNLSSDPSFHFEHFETRDESLGHRIQIPYHAMQTDPSFTTLYSKTLSPTNLVLNTLPTSSAGLSLEAIIGSLLMSGSGTLPLMTTSQPHKTKNHGPRRAKLNISYKCDALSKDDEVEGNGQCFHAQHYTAGETSAISRISDSYNTMQLQMLAAPNRGAELSQARETPQGISYPSSVSKSNSRRRSRQPITRLRRPSSAPPSGSSKASSRAVHGRIYGAAALSLLLRMLCLSHDQGREPVAVALESGSFWLQCHPISLPHITNDARDSDDREQAAVSMTWLAVTDMEAMWE